VHRCIGAYRIVVSCLNVTGKQTADSRQRTGYIFLHAVWCMLYTVYCMLYVICCKLYTVYCTLCAVWCILYAVYCKLYAVRCMLFAVCCVIRYALYAFCSMLYAFVLEFVCTNVQCILYIPYSTANTACTKTLFITTPLLRFAVRTVAYLNSSTLRLAKAARDCTYFRSK
jgi:hypothetical protein